MNDDIEYLNDLGQLNLNDSTLIDVTVANGEIILRIDYIEDYDAPPDKWETSIRLLTFKDCTELIIFMPPLVDCFGSILRGITQKTIDDKIYKYTIETNTSCNVISIVASSFLLSQPIQ